MIVFPPPRQRPKRKRRLTTSRNETLSKNPLQNPRQTSFQPTPTPPLLSLPQPNRLQAKMCPHTPTAAAAAASIPAVVDAATLKMASMAVAPPPAAASSPLAAFTAADLSPDARREAAAEWAKAVPASGAVAAFELLVAAGSAAGASPGAKEGAAVAAAELSRALGAAAEAGAVAALPALFALAGDKAAPVRAAAEDAVDTIVTSSVSWAARRGIVPHLLEATDAKCQWTTKVCALRALGELSKNAPKQVAAAVPDIIPAASYAVSDAKPQV